MSNSPLLDSSGTGTLCGCPTSGHMTSCQYHFQNMIRRERTGKAYYNSADFNSNYLGKWNPPYISHDYAYIPEREQMVARVLDMTRNNGMAAGAVDLWVDHLVGQFTPDPMPMYNCLKWDEDDAMEWAEIVLEFIDKYLMEEAYIDASGTCNFLELLQLAARNELVFGEVIATIEWLPTSRGSALQTAFNFIDPGRVRTPYEHRDKIEDGPLKRQAIDGFLKDKYGWCYGAYVFEDLCRDWSKEDDQDAFKYIRMKGRNETQHRHLLMHVYKKEHPEQTRGVSKFAPILEGMKMHAQLKREILLSAQARNKLLGAIKSSKDSAALANDLGMAQGKGPGGGGPGYGESPYSDHNDRRFRGLSPTTRNMAMRMQHHNQMNTEAAMGGVRLVQLWENEELDLVQPNNAGLATTGLSRDINNDAAAGMSIPTNMLQKNYESGTYSGLRSGRLDFFQAIRSARPRIDRVANIILRHAMDEAIAKRIVKFPTRVMRRIRREGLTPHDYYKENISSIMHTKWLGPPEKLIDPNREITGYFNAERYGYMNAGDIVGKVNGEVFNQFLEKRKRHCKQKIDAQVSCDEYEIRRRIETNNKLIAEGLIASPGNTELTANSATDVANNPNVVEIRDSEEPIVIEPDKNVESPLQEIIQSEEGQPLDTTNFILGEEDQLVPQRGRPEFSNTAMTQKLDMLNFKSSQEIMPDTSHLDKEEEINQVADAVLERLEPLLNSIADSAGRSSMED